MQEYSIDEVVREVEQSAGKLRLKKILSAIGKFTLYTLGIATLVGAATICKGAVTSRKEARSKLTEIEKSAESIQRRGMIDLYRAHRRYHRKLSPSEQKEINEIKKLCGKYEDRTAYAMYMNEEATRQAIQAHDGSTKYNVIRSTLWDLDRNLVYSTFDSTVSDSHINRDRRTWAIRDAEKYFKELNLN